MGLLSAATGAISGVLADQWREYFYCESMTTDILVSKGYKRVNEKRSSNTKASDNIITNGSIVAVNDGQFMMIVEQGKVVDFSAEPGEFVYDTSTEPSLFYGGFGKGLLESLKIIGRRFTFGGDTAKDQRVYFFNTKEIIGNKYGTSNPVPFRVVDKNIGLDIDIAIRCFGEYSYKFVDPVLFYKNICGNVESEYRREEIDSQLKSELMTALQPALSKISDMGVRYSALPGHAQEIANALNQVLSAQWKGLRGIAVASFGVSSVTASEEDEERIKQLQQAAVLKDPTMAAAVLASAQAQAMQDAAKNENGAFMAFAGMNAAANTGGMNAAQLYGMGQQAPAADTWVCAKCNHPGNTGKFCSNCGAPKPEAGGWTCAKCGQTGNTGKFCSNCGAVKP
ncbi:MAG: SPFH domain-containing protein [Eubacteriales bacterium]|nr:SPFH domain-containing protein [Eubacteriales bacterium]